MEVRAMTSPGGRVDDQARLARRRAVIDLYEQYHDMLLRLARGLVADEAAAEEAVRAALVRFYDTWDGEREVDDVAHELRVALCQATRSVNGPRRNKTVVTAGTSVATAVTDALQQLPARQRECVVLRLYAGFTESQIAAVTGCSIGTVRTHQKRAMARLAGLLSPMLEPAP